MRHNNANNNLGRKSAHRKAMLSNMASSLILHKRIKTTTAKAKALRVFIEPILTKSKEDSTHSRRLAFTYLQDKIAVTTLFREISPKITDRPGGYTRILKIGTRMGDAAEMCYIELVDFNETMLSAASSESKTTRRSRRGTAKKKAEGETPAAKGSEKTVKAKKESPKAAEKEEKAAEPEAPATDSEAKE
jgi:large subunit ribosomal protein L17